jgi:hypothetical protein
MGNDESAQFREGVLRRDDGKVKLGLQIAQSASAKHSLRDAVQTRGVSSRVLKQTSIEQSPDFRNSSRYRQKFIHL